MAMHKQIKYGYRYNIRGERGRYRYAKRARNDGDFLIADMWIVDARGRKDPGYNIAPVPFHVDQLSSPRKI